MEIVYPGYIAERSKPINLAKEDIALFASEFSRPINATTITLLKEAEILDDTIFQKFPPRFYSAYTHIGEPGRKAKAKRLLLMARQGDRIEKGVWIIDNWSAGYFHWMADALPRLIASETY